MRLLAITLVALCLTAPPLAAQTGDASSAPTAATDTVDAAPDDTSPPTDGDEPMAADAPTSDAESEAPAADSEAAVAEPGAAVEEPTSSATTTEAIDGPATIDETVVEIEEQEESTPVADADSDEPSILERQIVAFVASGVSVSSLAVGVVVGFLAWQQFNCLQNVLSCNETLAEPIRGADYFTARSNVEHLALIADMAYLFAGAAAIVAVTGFIRGFLLTDDSEEDEASTTSSTLPKQPSGLARALPDMLDARGAE